MLVSLGAGERICCVWSVIVSGLEKEREEKRKETRKGDANGRSCLAGREGFGSVGHNAPRPHGFIQRTSDGRLRRISTVPKPCLLRKCQRRDVPPDPPAKKHGPSAGAGPTSTVGLESDPCLIRLFSRHVTVIATLSRGAGATIASLPSSRRMGRVDSESLVRCGPAVLQAIGTIRIMQEQTANTLDSRTKHSEGQIDSRSDRRRTTSV